MLEEGFPDFWYLCPEELNKIRDDVSWLQLPVVVVVTPDGTSTVTGVAARAAPHMSPDWP